MIKGIVMDLDQTLLHNDCLLYTSNQKGRKK